MIEILLKECFAIQPSFTWWKNKTFGASMVQDLRSIDNLQAYDIFAYNGGVVFFYFSRSPTQRNFFQTTYIWFYILATIVSQIMQPIQAL